MKKFKRNLLIKAPGFDFITGKIWQEMPNKEYSTQSLEQSAFKIIGRLFKSLWFQNQVKN